MPWNRLRWYLPVIRERHLFISWPAPGSEDYCMDCMRHRRNWRHWGHPPNWVTEEED